MARPATADPTGGAAVLDVRPTVSVVIPCYQQAEYLPEAVGSVVAQTYRDWEVVIVDDGSTDATAEVAENLVAAHPDRRIRLVRQANAGLAAARNAGIAASGGRYILPLDADDILLPEMLARTVEVLQNDPAVAIAYTDCRRFGLEDRVMEMGVWDLDALAYSNQLVASALFRRDVWVAVGGYNPNMQWGYEDWDFWLGAAERGFNARRIAEPLFGYRIRATSMLTEVRDSHARELIRQLARNHRSIFTPARRLRHAVRRNMAAVGRRLARLRRWVIPRGAR